MRMPLLLICNLARLLVKGEKKIITSPATATATAAACFPTHMISHRQGRAGAAAAGAGQLGLTHPGATAMVVSDHKWGR